LKDIKFIFRFNQPIKIIGQKDKKNILLLIVLMFLPLLFNNCDDAVSDNNEYTAIDSRINIKLSEELLQDKRDLYLYCHTERIYGCINYGIDYYVYKGANSFKIKFNSVVISDICLTALGPASCRIELGELSEGTYNSNLEVNGKAELAILTVTNDSYKITHTPGFDFKFDNAEIKRVPDNLIWGSIGYINDSLANVVNTFLDSLQILGAAPVNLSAGDYGFFKIDSFSNIIPPENHGFPFIKMYLFDCHNHLEDVKGLMKRIQHQYVNQIYISCNTWQGDIYYGWIL
jgi:hypothetical protein